MSITKKNRPTEKHDLPPNVGATYVLKLIVRILSEVQELEQVLNKIHTLLCEWIRLDAFYFADYSAVEDRFEWAFTCRSGKQVAPEGPPVAEALLRQVLTDQETLLINSQTDVAKKASAEVKAAGDSTSGAVQSIIISPVALPGRPWGVLCLEKTEATPYTAELADFVENMCFYLALGLESSRILQKVKFEKSDSTPIFKKLAGRLSMTKGELLSKIDSVRRVGHELNQPLTGISGYCLLIKEEVGEGHPIYNDVCEIEKQASRLEQLVHELQTIVFQTNREG